MTRAETVRCWIFGLLAVAALVGTQWALADFISGHGSIADFVRATVHGPAATFTTIDLMTVAIVATIFMVVEGRRVGVPWLWVYVALVFVVAVSVAFPLFLIARTRRMAALRPA